MIRFFKKIKQGWIALLLLPLCCSCLQNNGNIGNLFGMWQLQEMPHTAVIPDSLEIPHRESLSYYLAFQSEVVNLRIVNNDSFDYYEAFGSFTQQGDSLTLHFKEGYWQIHQWIGFSTNPITLELKQQDAKSFAISHEGVVWRFNKH